MSKETLLSQSTVWIYGRVLADLTINAAAYDFPKTDPDADKQDAPARYSRNDFLLQQLNPQGKGALAPHLARIVAFAFEGQFYSMARPALFLVHGDGIDTEWGGGPGDEHKNVPGTMPLETGRTGLVKPVGSFAAGIKVWAYSRHDITLRLDMDSGTFESVLLDAELSALDPSGGAMVQSSGAMVRSAGAMVRSSGAMLRGRRGNSNE